MPIDALGRSVELGPSRLHEGATLVEWRFPSDDVMDLAPFFAQSITSLLRGGPGASELIQRSAAAAMKFLMYAPMAHEDVALWQFMPPLADVVDVVILCTKLRRPCPLLDTSPLLCALQLLASLSAVAPEHCSVVLRRCPELWGELRWLPVVDHARHASLVLHIFHCVTMAAVQSEGVVSPPLCSARRFVAIHLLTSDAGMILA